jgi:prepilin-type N-terminal cleavage/methylation domain-containing protein
MICLRERHGRESGFTLNEVMIAAAVLTVVVTGVLTAHLFGLRMFQITKAKLGANDDARKSIARLTQEIRGAQWLQVGDGDQEEFVPIEDGLPQQGAALQIYTTDEDEPFIRYYLDPSQRQLLRIESGDSQPEVIAHSISNQVVFASENSGGQVLTNSENNRVVSLTLSFYQIQYPIIKVGPGEYYDSYQLRTRITRRRLE